jgi:sporulation protein YlmC with PRC-barrel domain
MVHRGMIGKRVVDPEGIELGVVSKMKENCIEISEGLFDELLLNKTYIGKEEEEQVILKNKIHNLLAEMEVLGSDGERIGIVKETVSAGDVLDTLIIETDDKNLFFITLEEIYKIDEKMTLDLDLEALKKDGRLEG